MSLISTHGIGQLYLQEVCHRIPDDTVLSYLLTYLDPLLMVEHRPSTTRRQSMRLWAVAAALVQMKPWASVSLLQP